jgi:HSP20 family protein
MNIKSLLPIRRDRNLGLIESHPFTTLQREIDRVFDDFTRGFPSFKPTFGVAAADLTPTMDVAETDKEIEITAELPGLEEKDVEITAADNILTIRGEKRADKEEKERNYRFVERSYGAFSRTLELPEGVNLDAIKATIDKGVLKVTVPKPVPAQAKKIEVRAAA